MTKVKKHFSAIAQRIVIILLISSMLLIAQQISSKIYQIGLIMLMVSVILQIGFGNIPSTANFGRTMKLLAIILLIIVSVFLLGIVLAPVFVRFVMGG